ncbi:hypothetical protein G4B84_000659 [Aspergillus flavus NRRL3357]|nr:uncharacterized protein G4B84_000659 [Aspergillus flavus NRRL3357]QMW25414.1 hypothetical protein G4B84_000659 [Aspergillus flavus NRRL3357]QMW37483.1 hypothetical protein G4B11_000719 [Aspergillus flavus]
MNRYRNAPSLRGPTKATASTLCQKCLKRDMYLPSVVSSHLADFLHGTIAMNAQLPPRKGRTNIVLRAHSNYRTRNCGRSFQQKLRMIYCARKASPMIFWQNGKKSGAAKET